MITAPEKNIGLISHRQPHFLPDSRHFLYVAASVTTQDSRIMIAELPSGGGKAVVAGKPIMPGDAHVCWAPPGFLLFVRENNLMAQRFDPEGARFTGEPMLVAEHVTIGGLRSTADFSVSDNGVLVYGSGASVSNRLTWFDRQGKLLETIEPRESFRNVVLSPDGKTAAAESTKVVNSALNLWLFDLARRTPSRFTFEAFLQTGPVWSGDGKTLYYAWQREDSWGLYRKDVSGVGSPELILASKRLMITSDLSPGGDWLIYDEIGENGKAAIWALPLREGRAVPGGKPLRLTQPEFTCRRARVSKDGKFIAYSSSETPRTEVYVRSFNPETPASGGKWQISASGGDIPFWSPDGKELLFLTPDNKLMAVPFKTAGGFQAGVPTPLFDTHAQSYSVTADGKRILAAVQLTDAKAAAATVVLHWSADLGK
jgi:dipeptidyl aminopeptidase/acylaminoacyl peptidase